MTTRKLPLLICAALTTACGTKYIADLDEQELASSDGGGSTGEDDGPGQTVTSGVDPSGDSGTSGEAVECEPDPNAVCGPTPEEPFGVLAPSPPVSGGTLPLSNEYDCTITELEWIDTSRSRIMLDCGLEFPTDASVALPQVTYDKLSVDQEVQARFSIEEAGNGNALTLSVDGHPLVIAMHGTTVDPIVGTAVFAPFAVTANEDECLASCDVVDDYCYAPDRQSLVFTIDDEEIATVWSAGRADVTIDGIDYAIEVGQAVGAEKVNPDSWWCMMQGYSYYNFRIADVTP